MSEKNTQLEFYKIILEKVSFDRILFEKEFKKALIGLSYKDSKPIQAASCLFQKAAGFIL